MRKLRKTLFTLFAVVSLGGGAMIAFAAWTADGSGSGYVQATNAQEVTTAVATTEGALYPGGTAAVLVAVQNPNPFPVKVTGITAGTGDIESGNTTCDASHGVSFTPPGTLDQVIAANGSHTFSLANAASMTNASVNECQGEVFEIPVNIEAESAAA